MKNNGMIKSMHSKKLWSKITASVAVVGIAIGSIFAFTGCQNTNTPTPSIDPGTKPVQPVVPDPGDIDKPIESISFEDFLAEHKDKALDFVHEFVSPRVRDGRTVKNESISISANEDDELSNVDFLCTYSFSGQNRVMEYASVKFNDPIDLDKIVDGTVSQADVSLEIQADTLLTWNAQSMHDSQDVAKAIYKVASLSDYSEAKIYEEVESGSATLRSFNFVELDGNDVNVRNVTVTNVDDSTLLTDLGNRIKAKDKGIVTTYTMGGETIQTQNYVLEDTGSTIDPTKPGQEINSIDDLVKNYSSELASALENNFLDKIGKTLYGRTLFDSNKLLSTSWDIGTNDTISEIKLISTYKTSSTSNTITVGTIKLATPIIVKDINKDNMNTIWASNVNSSTYSGDYSFNYQVAEQGTRDALVDAIFEANGIAKTEGATRLFVDGGSRVDDELKGSAHEFKVAEITDNGIQEFTILVKEANNDTGYINNLKNSSNYRIYSEKSCSYSSNQVSNNATNARSWGPAYYLFSEKGQANA